VLYFALDTVSDQSVEIPNRAAFKASDVCEIAQIPPYVLRSWEKEFPGLGVSPRPGGPRVYRRGDVEQILRIKQLVFAEGLTLAGARRKLESEPPDEEDAAIEMAQATPAMPDEVRARVEQAKQDLRSLLAMLSAPGPTGRKTARPWGSEADARTPPAVSGDAQSDVACNAAGGLAARPGAEPASEDMPLLSGTPDVPRPRRARRRPRDGHRDEAKSGS
jgi:DNA-binding transcriptional MerR regulator